MRYDDFRQQRRTMTVATLAGGGVARRPRASMGGGGIGIGHVIVLG